MPGHAIRARPPSGAADVPPWIGRDPDVLASFLEDAAHFPGGFAAGLAAPASEAELAALLRASPSVLAIGAQSSLTGGATPHGEVIVSTSRLKQVGDIGADRVRAGAGVT